MTRWEMLQLMWGEMWKRALFVFTTSFLLHCLILMTLITSALHGCAGMTNANLISLLSRLKGKPLPKAKEQTQTKVYRIQRQESWAAGRLQETVRPFFFFFALFISFCQKRQLPVRARLVFCHFLLSVTIAAFCISLCVLWESSH